ncbi:DUF2207 domain-containing protein [Agromyces bracchium]|uniref:DUF2207 domain-containing protein n=2 Tax=Agromyces bracchium TaxID=88376 RepID=A0A6I3M6W2_9MICO|nr:DUF2207 domain-containing protein [Agromyces bracchium]MTH68701.1 DUF2207 domain-containing protein [Agromyces bracchium]
MTTPRPTRRRQFLVAASALAALALGIGPAAAAAASPPVLAASSARSVDGPVAAVPADVDDFTFASFDAVYELGRDGDGRSTLRTTETLVAVFPEYDQNRGIRRAIPRNYDGHPTDIRIRSVFDQDGVPRSFETERSEDGEFELVTIAADDFVHGEQTYVITYDQRNVTFDPDDLDLQEFYWDVNGTGWRQPFGVVRAEVRLEPDLVEAFTGDVACYSGYEGSSTPCASLEVQPDGAPIVVARADLLGPYQNLTVALGFAAGTFEPRDERFTSSPAAMTSLVGALAAIAVAVTAGVMRATRWRDHPGRGLIIAEYEPPERLTLMEAADLVKAASKGITATLLAEAVDRRVRVIETGSRKYTVQLAAPIEGADRDATAVLRAVFGPMAAIGSRRDLKSRDATLGTKLARLRTSVHSRVEREGLRRRPDRGMRALLSLLAIGAAVLAAVFGFVALDERMGGGWPWLTILVAGAMVFVTFGLVGVVRPLTERGRALRDHLEGLEEYIRLAEADRLRVLQSPTGAERAPMPALDIPPPAPGAIPTGLPAPVGSRPIRADGTPDPEAVLRLNERLLPYSVLFGMEREWSQVLAALYAEQGREPDWYSGRSGFHAGYFAASVSSFSSVSSTSWSGSSSSSSSGGSSGGGSSGGGGGGGGGGGV